MELIFSRDIRNMILSRLSSNSILAWASASRATYACVCNQFWLDLITYRWGPQKKQTKGLLKEYKNRYQNDLTELLSAAEKYNITTIRNILARGIEYDFNFLVKMLQLNDSSSLEFLVERVDFNLSQQDRYGETLLFKVSDMTSKEYHLSVLLSTNQIDLNLTNKIGQTALIRAVDSSKIDIAKKLIDAGADLNFQDNYGRTALMNACQKGYSDLVKYMLKRCDVEVNLRDLKGFTAALLSYNDDNLLAMLQKKGADLNMVNNQDETILMICLKNKSYSSLNRLLQYDNIDVNMRDSTGKTILHHAILKRSSIQVLRSILHCKRIDINARDKKNETALFKACNFGYIDLVKILLQYKPNLEHGSSALFAAVKQDYAKIVKILLQYDCFDINKRNRSDDTPLILAVRENNLKTVQELIKHQQLDLLIEDSFGFTARQIALMKGFDEIAQILTERENQIK